jgi:phage shock protein C
MKEIDMMNQRLYRSRTDRMIGGVCGGLASFFNIDPTIVRLIFVLLLLTGSAGFWIYVILLVVVPEEPQGSSNVIDAEPNGKDNKEE